MIPDAIVMLILFWLVFGTSDSRHAVSALRERCNDLERRLKKLEQAGKAEGRQG